MNALRTLRAWIAESGSAVFFGGAGVSTESGIPDFRSASGLYSIGDGRYPPEFMLSHSCLVQHPEEFFAFHREHLLYPDAKPNAAHLALAELERCGQLAGVVTQNVDGLHQLAGSRVVHELHGSVHRNYCLDCGRTHPMGLLLATTGVPRCECGGVVRPDVVLYQELLDLDVLDAATRLIADADLLIVGGTSLNVYPAAGLIDYYRGDRLVLINLTATPFDHRADLVIHESVGRTLADAVS